MFEALIREVAQRFGLGDKAKDLLGALLATVFDEKSGGIAGLLAKFRQQGLGDLFNSWLGNAQAPPIEPQQLENVLGSNTLSGIADRLGIARGTTVAAASAMLPKLIGLLSPNGQLPSGVPSGVSSYFGNLGQVGAKVGGAVRGAETAVQPPAASFGWLKWLVLAVIILALGWCMLNRQTEMPVPTTGEKAAPATPTADPNLSLSNDAGVVTYSGTVGSDTEKSQLVDALNTMFGADHVSGNVNVDASTKPANWLTGLLALLPDFMKAPGAKLDFAGDTITLSGNLADADRTNLAAALKNQLGSLTLKGLEPAAAPTAMSSASEALKNLAPGQYTAADLVKALNLMSIEFDTGSASISAASVAALGDAAAALKNAPAGTRVEIGGHTDNTGNADANLKLSDDRANAVRAKLVELGVPADMLVAKGYGDTKPIADNATEEGRAKNRRMEFTVIE